MDPQLVFTIAYADRNIIAGAVAETRMSQWVEAFRRRISSDGGQYIGLKFGAVNLRRML